MRRWVDAKNKINWICKSAQAILIASFQLDSLLDILSSMPIGKSFQLTADALHVT